MFIFCFVFREDLQKSDYLKIVLGKCNPGGYL